MKLSPIVGRPNCPTRRLSYFLDTFLKPYLKHVKNLKVIFEIALDFLNKCPREVNPNTEKSIH